MRKPVTRRSALFATALAATAPLIPTAESVWAPALSKPASVAH